MNSTSIKFVQLIKSYIELFHVYSASDILKAKLLKQSRIVKILETLA